MHPLVELAVPDGAVAIHWFEQASFAVKDGHGTIVLIDPYFPHDRPGDVFIHAMAPVVEADIRTDFVLLTHEHGDHTHPETVQRIREAWPGAVFVGPRESAELIVAESGVDPAQVVTVEAGQAAQLGTMTAHAVYAKPPQGDPAASIGEPDTTHLGYVVRAGEVGIYISGDLLHTFADHPSLLQPVAALDPDIGFITCHPTEGEFPFFEGVVRLAEAIGLAEVAPAHYGCFVARDYDPQAWAAHFGGDGPRPVIIPRNTYIIYPS